VFKLASPVYANAKEHIKAIYSLFYVLKVLMNASHLSISHRPYKNNKVDENINILPFFT